MLRRSHKVKSCLETRMKKDAAECAAILFEDLKIRKGSTDVESCLGLCSLYGEPVHVVSKSLLGKHRLGAYCPPFLESFRGTDLENAILIRDDVFWESKVAAILIHELAHRLTASDAYAYLNKPHFAEYPWRYFWELVAYGVQRHFQRAGGKGPHSLRSLGRLLD